MLHFDRPGSQTQAFKSALREFGYVEGRNLQFEERSGGAQPERLAGLAEELVRAQLDVLVSGTTATTRAAMKAGPSAPIVFLGSTDPVGSGLVASLARPGGNVTGFSLALGEGFAPKWLELLKQAAPSVQHVAALWNARATDKGHRFATELNDAAQRLKLRIDQHRASTPAELDEALAAIGASAARALIVTGGPLFGGRRKPILEFAAARRVPAIYFSSNFVEEGGLMSYGPNTQHIARRAASHVDRILKGTKAGDIPVEQPTVFELVLNRTTARALGLTFPKALLVAADRVIE